MIIRVLKTVAALAALLILSACGGEPTQPQETLEERIVARWDLILERDFEAVWDYHTPGFRQTTPRFDFARDMARRPVLWTAAELRSVDCEGDRCEVRVRVTYRPVGGPGPISRMEMDRTIDEVWIRVADNWWFAGN